jgi:tetratricopeptide (TPR) repeat protein
MSALEDQRDFLLRSLEDLERELAAGDVDAEDYAALKDDYTARAAAVLRALDEGRAPAAVPRPRRSGRRLALVLAGVVGFAVLAGGLVAQTAGRRDSGDQATGDIRQSITERLNEAGRLGSTAKKPEDYEEAIAIYDDVLAADPDNAEAQTYRAWFLNLAGDSEGGLIDLVDAAEAHPEYPDVHAFLAVVLERNGLADVARRELDRLDALDPPAYIRELVAPMRERLDAAAASTSTTTG